ncbi:MAG: SDR family NAD(P)-dependent oxidoreductase [Pseudomonadota bacterium]
MDLGLRDKRAIITGATKGIGRRILEQLIAEGCTVATCSRSVEDVEEVIEKCSTRKAEVIGAVGRAVYGRALAHCSCSPACGDLVWTATGECSGLTA